MANPRAHAPSVKKYLLHSDLFGGGDRVDAAPLDVDDDFFDVLKEVFPVAAKWKAVGQALRLKLGVLESIAASHPRNMEECLSEMLTHWLKRNYNVQRFGEPSWQRLVEVVGDPAGGANPALASQIAEKHRAKETTSAVPTKNSYSEMSLTEEAGYVSSCEPDDLVQGIMKQPAWEYLWYHGKISRKYSEELLKNTPDGYFLVRESTTQPDSYALSLKHRGEVKHRIIHFRDDCCTYEIQGTRKRFTKITDLVLYYQQNYISISGEILRVSCPQNFEFRSTTSSGFDNQKFDKSPHPSYPLHLQSVVKERSTTPSPPLEKGVPFPVHEVVSPTTPPPVPSRITPPPAPSQITPPPLPLQSIVEERSTTPSLPLEKEVPFPDDETEAVSQTTPPPAPPQITPPPVPPQITPPPAPPQNTPPPVAPQITPLPVPPQITPPSVPPQITPPPVPPQITPLPVPPQITPPPVPPQITPPPVAPQITPLPAPPQITPPPVAPETTPLPVPPQITPPPVAPETTPPAVAPQITPPPLPPQITPPPAPPQITPPPVSPETTPPPAPPQITPPPVAPETTPPPVAPQITPPPLPPQITPPPAPPQITPPPVSPETTPPPAPPQITPPPVAPQITPPPVPPQITPPPAPPQITPPPVSPEITPPPAPPQITPPPVAPETTPPPVAPQITPPPLPPQITPPPAPPQITPPPVSPETTPPPAPPQITPPPVAPQYKDTAVSVLPTQQPASMLNYPPTQSSPSLSPSPPHSPPSHTLLIQRSPPHSPPSHTLLAAEQQPTSYQYSSTALQPLQKRTAENSEKFTYSITEEGIKRAEVMSTASFKLSIIPSSQKSMAKITTIEAELVRDLDQSVVRCTITHKGESEYEVAYRPENRGRHTLSLRIDSHEIQGSPSTVFVSYPAYMLGQSLRTFPDASVPQLSRPIGIALDDRGSQIVVCDSRKECVFVLSREGRQIQEIFPWGAPYGVACGKDGSLYITFSDLHQIQKFTNKGVFIKGVGGKGSNPTQFKKPKGVAVNRGLVYVCDSGNSRVQIFDSDLNFVSSFGEKGSSPMSLQLISPVDAAFDSSGHIYVADCIRNRVIQFSLKYLYIKTFGNERSAGCKLNCPQGVCVGPNDAVYVTDCDHCVSVYQASGKLLANFGRRGSEAGQFSHPCGVAVDDDGFVYVSDRDNGRIQVF